MEIKKSPKADLQNKRGLLLEIGLIIALGGVIAAFAWTPKEQKIEKLDLNIAPVEEEIMEITRQEQKPPEPPKKTEITVITDILKVVTNDTKITTNVDFAEFEDDVEIVQQVAVEEEEIVEEQPFLVAETMPSFQGGSLNDFRNWVQSKVRYPAIAQENGISGKVVLTFVIEKDGRIEGYAYAHAFVGRAAYDWAAELTIYLDHDARRGGLGRVLYEALADRLKAMGVLNLYACIGYPQVEDEYLTRNSAQFHEHLGFTLAGTFHNCGYKFGRWYDMIWMEKIIGEHRPDQPDIVPYQY